MIVAANRGPVTYERSPDGALAPRRGAGGLVSALRGLTRDGELTWIASAISEGDREFAAMHPRGQTERVAGGTARVRMLAHERRAYEGFYGDVASSLWFTQHQLWDLPYEPSFGSEYRGAWEDGYTVVNRSFGEAVAEELAARPTRPVVLHDYHLYVAPRTVRRLVPTAPLALFVHVPWPSPDAFGVLPRRVVAEALDGVLACDLVGLHTERWRQNFIACCVELAGARWESEFVVIYGNRPVRVVARPISVSPGELREAAAADAVVAEERLLGAHGTEQLIVRVDRTDPSKNIVRGFEALESLLERWPEHRGRVRMLALLNPSRQGVPAYRRYRESIDASAARVNERYGSPDWTPVQVDIADNFARSLAAYKIYDVLFVNPVFDGMNLVAKEGPLLNERDGAVVLSENAGAHDELREFVISVNPFDVAEQASALHEALTLADDERARRARGLRAAVESRPVEAWSEGLLADLAEAVAADGRTIERW